MQVKSIDGDLQRWRELEKLQMTTATPVPIVAAGLRPFGPVSVRANVEPGIKLARFVIAKLAARYDGCDAATYAEKRWNDSTPEVALALKAAVAAGNTTERDLGEAADQSGDRRGFPAAAARRDDPRQDPGPAESARSTSTCRRRPAGGTINWVGELKPKPVSAMAFAMENLGFNKVAAIVVLSVRNSCASAIRPRKPSCAIRWSRTLRRFSTGSSSIRRWPRWRT